MTTQWSIYKSSERGVQRVFLRRTDVVAVKETDDGHSILMLSNGAEFPISANAVSIMATISDPPAPPTIIVQNATTLSPTFRGGAEAFAIVNVRDGATIIVTATADATGEWEVGGSAFSVGDHLVSATQTNLFGLVSEPSEPVKLTIAEPVPPPAPTLTAQVSDPASVNAAVAGQAQADAVVIVYDGTAVLSTTRADANGNWTLVSDPLTPGSHSLTATQTSSNGLVSPPSVAVDVVIAEPAPVPEVAAAPGAAPATPAPEAAAPAPVAEPAPSPEPAP
jgi:large repetitive protein